MFVCFTCVSSVINLIYSKLLIYHCLEYQGAWVWQGHQKRQFQSGIENVGRHDIQNDVCRHE